MESKSVAVAMRTAARAFVDALPDHVREAALRGFDDPRRRWLEYRPRPRPGTSLGELDAGARKAAHRLLATALSPHAYAQAMAIIALEEVLDRVEGWDRGRHSNDYSVVLFGTPAGDGPWAWRFEGHHVSLTMTVEGDAVSPTPVFLGANPARTTYAGRDVLRPLGPEEDLARALLDAMDPRARAEAVVSGEPPPDIRSGPRADFDPDLRPPGIAAARLGPSARALLAHLVALYLSRLPDELAAGYAAGFDPGTASFAWEGSLLPHAGHYYRITAPDLFIEYDNTDNDANHAHTVLRRPGGDFGGDVLAAHRAEAH
jgi:hypothetical protein